MKHPLRYSNRGSVLWPIVGSRRGCLMCQPRSYGLTLVELLVVTALSFLLLVSGSAYGQEPGQKGLSVDFAYFCPDKEVPREFPWRDGWDFEQYFPKHSVLAGSFHVYLKNPTKDPIAVSSIFLNETPLEKLHDDLAVTWWRVLPNPVLSGEMAEVIIRLKEPPTKAESRIRLETKAGPVECTVKTGKPQMELGYVAFSPKLDRIYAYLEKSGEARITLSEVLLDGEPVATNTRLYPDDFFENLSLLEIDLKRPLREGTFHVLKVSSAEGPTAVAMVRVWPSDFFHIGIFALDWMDSYVDYNLNTSLLFSGAMHPEYIDQLGEYGYKAMPGRSDEVTGEVDANYYYSIRDKEEVYAHYFFDEPDVKDFPDNRRNFASVAKFRKVKVHDSLGACAMMMEHFAESIRDLDPDTLTHLMINQTYKPDNYSVYGKIADIAAVDIYAHIHGNDPRIIYQAGNACRLGSAPRPFHIVTDFIAPGEGWNRDREITAEELRLRLGYSLAAGAKGITWYYWRRPKSDRLLKELTEVNGKLEIAAPLLEIGHPVPQEWTQTNHEKLMTRTLLCGKDTVVVVLINTDYKAGKDGFSHTPVKSAEVRVTLPGWMKETRVFSVSPDGMEDVSFSRQKDGVAIRLRDFQMGDFFVCTANPGLKSSLWQRWTDLVAHRTAVRDRREERVAKQRQAINDSKYRVKEAEVIGAREVSAKLLWNPLGEDLNAFQLTMEKPGTSERVSWKFSVKNAGVPYLIGIDVLSMDRPGITFVLDVKDAEGAVLESDGFQMCHNWHTDADFGKYFGPHRTFELEVTFPAPGEYTAEVLQVNHPVYPTSMSVARHVYVKPLED